MAYGSVGENYGAGVGGGVGGYGGYAPNGQPIGYGVPGSGGYSNPSVVSYGGIGPGFGGAAGISPYDPSIAGPPAPFQAPVYSNSMSNWLGGAAPAIGGAPPPWEQSNITRSAAWNANENAQLADVRTLTSGGGFEVPGYQNSMFDAYFSSPFAIGVANSMGVDPAALTTGRSWGSDYVASGGNVYGLAGRGSSVFGPWDPQGTAYNMMYRNQISPELGASNLGNMANYINSQGYFANPNAGQALASIAGAESSGNPWARNPETGATGMFQWMGPRLPAAQNALGADWSPQAQGSWAAAEMGQPQYGPSWATLNNPGASVGQMQNALINNFEGLGGYPSQAASDRAGASAYLPVLQAGFQPTTGFHR